MPTLELVKVEEVKPGDLMEDNDNVFRPVLHVENPPSSAWYFVRVSPQGVRLAMRGSWVMVGRE